MSAFYVTLQFLFFFFLFPNQFPSCFRDDQPRNRLSLPLSVCDERWDGEGSVVMDWLHRGAIWYGICASAVP